MEQLGVQAAHRNSGSSGRNRDPERSQNRAAIPLLDVLPAEMQPQFMAAVAVDQIAPGTGERSGLDCRISERHWNSSETPRIA
jgi:hypothetical protein